MTYKFILVYTQFFFHNYRFQLVYNKGVVFFLLMMSMYKNDIIPITVSYLINFEKYREKCYVTNIGIQPDLKIKNK
jgi:hypothetical protein